jgi:hypothetical protein
MPFVVGILASALPEVQKLPMDEVALSFSLSLSLSLSLSISLSAACP